MVRKQTTLVVIALLALMIMVVPMAHAACGDAAGPGVNWAGCDKTGVDLTGIDMTGANLNGAILVNAIIDNTNFTNANLNNVDMTGAVGTPTTTGANFNNVTCPDGSPAAGTEPFCAWTPTAIALTGISAALLNNLWPWAITGILLLGLVLLVVVRRKRQLSAV